MKILALVIILICVYTVSVLGDSYVPFKNCDNSNDYAMPVNDIVATKWPLSQSATVDFSISFDVTTTVSSGHYHTVLQGGGLVVVDDKGTLSQLAADLNMTLPIKPGPLNIPFTVTTPKDKLPSSNLLISATSPDGPLFCVNIDISE